MSEIYKLVFRGEVLEGQHAAVVRKRLAAAGLFDEAALDKLFSGRPVVLKRQADTATATRLQNLFRKAGARLRVLPVEEAGPGSEPVADAGPVTHPVVRLDPASEPDPAPGSLALLPAGSDVLREDERVAWQPRQIDTGSLALAKARFMEPPASGHPPAPEVSHLSLAAPGSPLLVQQPVAAEAIAPPEFQMAEVGVDLAPRTAPATPSLDLTRLDFQVAAAGEDLSPRRPTPPPPSPDVSHLGLQDDAG